MIPFQAPCDDILFSLTRIAGADRLPDWDEALAREVVEHFARLAEAEIAPADALADHAGCRLDNGRVRMPQALRAAYDSYAGQGWPSLSLPEEAGGQGVSGAIAGAVSEIFSGASHALQMVTGLVPGAARLIGAFATQAQKAQWLPRLASGEWLATMALTEPAAGSDLSGLRTSARQGPDGWRLHGEKIFISGGDQDLTPRILHLVLARSGDPGQGVKGLSLFLVPSHDEAGRRMPVRITRIEEKMGLHGSPTCQMIFEDTPAQLIGAEGEGLKLMFTMMNHARLDVALQGVAHATRAARIARAYAAERVQGLGARALTEHADIRRMLDEADMLAIGGRGLVHLALVELELGQRPDLVEMLTPICKYHCTEAGVQAASLGMQVLGGYGYLREYGIEQRLRDARITPIYEGANGVHAATLAGRLLHHRNGIAADAFTAFLQELPDIADLWTRARRRVEAASDPAQGADSFMRLSAHAALSVIWARIAAAAQGPGHADYQRLATRFGQQRALWLSHWSELLALELHPVAA